MSVYDDNVEPTSDSFWEIGQYKKTVKRVDDSFDMCTKLMQLIQERADIEKGYSSNLKKWSLKWKAFLDKGPEYGTLKSAWIGFTEEADSISDVHSNIRNRLIDNVQAELKTWQKENYHKSALPPQRLKNSKDLEEKFQRAQKPWAKQYKSVQDCKKAYHSACKLEAGLQQQQAAAKADGAVQPEAAKKLADKLRKAEKEVAKSRQAYETAIAELDGQRAGYTSGMSDVFAESQDFERGRMEFFKTVLGHLHEALNIANEERIPETYDNLLHTIQRADATQDLRWWAQNHGDCMPAQWPQFEEFGAASSGEGGGGGSGSVRGKKSGGSSLTADEPAGRGGGGVGGSNARNSGQQLQQQQQSNDTDSPTGDNYRRSQQQQQPTRSQQARPASSYSDSLNPFAEPTNSRPANNSNPFDDEMPPQAADGSASGALEDDGRHGVPVRALYDYAGTEEDELSFMAGDVFEKLDDEDEQGWCKGRKDARVGLYPANYVEPA